MNDILTMERFADLRGMQVRSADEREVGTVSALFCDDLTGEPEWMGVRTGFLGIKEIVVPVRGARVHDNVVHVPYDKDVIRQEPKAVKEGGTLTPESEHRLCVYFALTGHRPGRHQLTRYDFMRMNF